MTSLLKEFVSRGETQQNLKTSDGFLGWCDRYVVEAS
jgi:hypothetical protein